MTAGAAVLATLVLGDFPVMAGVYVGALRGVAVARRIV